MGDAANHSDLGISATPNLTEPNRSRKPRYLLWIVSGALLLFCIAVLGIGLVAFRFYSVKFYYIPAASMEPTLMGHDRGVDPLTGAQNPTEIHDHIMVNRLAYRHRLPNRGEIITFLAKKKADKAAKWEHREPVENVQ